MNTTLLLTAWAITLGQIDPDLPAAGQFLQSLAHIAHAVLTTHTCDVYLDHFASIDKVGLS